MLRVVMILFFVPPRPDSMNKKEMMCLIARIPSLNSGAAALKSSRSGLFSASDLSQVHMKSDVTS